MLGALVRNEDNNKKCLHFGVISHGDVEIPSVNTTTRERPPSPPPSPLLHTMRLFVDANELIDSDTQSELIRFNGKLMETGGRSSVEVENLAPLIIMICRLSVQKIKEPFSGSRESD